MKSLVLLVLLSALGGLARAADAPFLWEVQGPQARHYLAGSVHLLPQSAYPLPEALDRAYDRTRELVLETDPGALSTPNVQREMLERGLSVPGLPVEVGTEIYARVRTQAAELELPPEVCDAFKPWFCALSLSVLSFQRAGFDPALGVDRHFYQRAVNEGRPVRWLESPTEQLDMFSAMSEDTSAQFLRSTLDQLGDPEFGVEELVRLWRENDVAGMGALVETLRTETPEVYERLLRRRNAVWMAPLMEMFGQEKPVLVLVGATHLLGADGLVARLRAAGFELRAVPLQPAVAPEVITAPGTVPAAGVEPRGG